MPWLKPAKRISRDEILQHQIIRNSAMGSVRDRFLETAIDAARLALVYGPRWSQRYVSRVFVRLIRMRSPGQARRMEKRFM